MQWFGCIRTLRAPVTTPRAIRYLPVLFGLSWVAPSHAASSGEGLVVETESPDALCPDLTTTREAIRNRLGTLTVEGDRQGWTARYTVGHAPGAQADFVRLRLLNPAGEERLSRDIPASGESCAMLAQAIALVVERYFRALISEEFAPPPPEPTNASAPPRTPDTAPAVSPRSEPAVVHWAPEWSLGVGLGLATAQPGAIVGLQGGAWVGERLHLEIGLLADLGSHEERFSSADLRLRSFPALMSVGYGRRLPRWDYFSGPELRWTLEKPTGDGLAGLDTRPGAQFSAGLAGGLSFWPEAPIGFTLRASVDYVVSSTQFRIQTGNTSSERVLTLAPIQALLTIGVAFGKAVKVSPATGL